MDPLVVDCQRQWMSTINTATTTTTNDAIIHERDDKKNTDNNTTTTVNNILDVWLDYDGSSSSRCTDEDEDGLMLKDAVLEHSTRWVLTLLQQQQQNNNNGVVVVEPVTTKRCHVALHQLLYAYNPKSVEQRRYRRKELVPGSATRAYHIYKAMMHHPTVTIDDQTIRLVLQILARDQSSSSSNNNYQRSLELIQHYQSTTTQQQQEERLRQERWMYNQVLACLANSSLWDKAYLAMKLFTDTMQPNIDASSYAHTLRACRPSCFKTKKLGQKISLQLWDKHISKCQNPQQLSPHVYTFLFQTLPSSSQQQQFIPILEHACQMGKVNSHVLMEILKHKDIFLSSNHTIQQYLTQADNYNKNQKKIPPPHQQATSLFKLIPKQWSSNVTSSSTNTFGW